MTKTLVSIATGMWIMGALLSLTSTKTESQTPQTELAALTAKITALDNQVQAIRIGHVTAGPSGALDCTDFGPDVCDVVTGVVPFKRSANHMEGLNLFDQLYLKVYKTADLPTCDGIHEGWVLGVSDLPNAGHVAVYCNGSGWLAP